MPSVSIIMNCYNGEKYLAEALKSVLNQTLKDWELIFIDNCSSDQSKNILEKFSDTRIRYFNTKSPIKLGAARKFGIDQAKSDWIGFLDTDDLWESTKLEKQLEVLKSDKFAICYGGVREITSVGGVIRNYFPKNDEANLSSQLKQFDINMVTPLISRSFLQHHGLNFNEDIFASEEYNLFLRILAKGKAIVIPEILGVGAFMLTP